MSRFDMEKIKELSNTHSQGEIALMFNTSREYISKLMRKNDIVTTIASRNNNIIINQEAKDIIIGGMLGDGHIRKADKKSLQYRFTLSHSVKQLDYINWKYDLMNAICKSEPRKIKNRDAYSLVTISHIDISNIHSMFYQGNIKIIPDNIKELLTPLTLAVWYMDDGSRQGKNTGYLHTNCFKQDEIDLLIYAINSKYRLNVYKANKNNGTNIYNVIYIPSESFIRFKEIVKPYIIPSMKYKIEDTLATTVYEDSRTEDETVCSIW